MDPPSDGSPSQFSALRAALESDALQSEVDLLSDDSLRRLAPEIHNSTNSTNCLRRVRDLQKEHDSIFDQYIKEKQELENKFEARFAPLFVERRQALETSGIKHFWSEVFDNCEMLRENITKADALAMQYLTDVSCETITSGTINPKLPLGSFTLKFHFSDNPFFENDLLTKTYVMHEDDFEDMAEARGCKVLWKAGKDLTLRIFKKKTKSGRVSIKKQPADSFFNFFNPPQPPDPDADMDPELLEELEDVRDADLELGECIRSELIPRALLYYLNIIEGDEELDEHIAEDDDDDDDDEDDEGDIDADGPQDSADDDDDIPANSRMEHSNNEKPPEECKQQ